MIISKTILIYKLTDTLSIAENVYQSAQFDLNTGLECRKKKLIVVQLIH